MSENILSTRIQLKRDTAENWNAVSATFRLLPGELAFETNTGYVKLGINGEEGHETEGALWKDTPYINISDYEKVTGLTGYVEAVAEATLQSANDYTDEKFDEVSAVLSVLDGEWIAGDQQVVDKIELKDGQVSVTYKTLEIIGVSGLSEKLDAIDSDISYLGLTSADHETRLDVAEAGLEGLSGRMDSAEATIEDHAIAIDAVSSDYLKATTFNTLSNAIGLSAASEANPVATYDDIKDIISHGINIRGEVNEDVDTESSTYKPTTGEAGEYYATNDPKAGDLIVNTKDTSEYLYVGEFGEGKNGHFIRIGDESRYVLKTTKVNGYELSSDVTLDATDIKVSSTDARTVSAALGDLSIALDVETKRATDVEAYLSTSIDSKVKIKMSDSETAISTDLVIEEISEDAYMEKVANGESLVDAANGKMYVMKPAGNHAFNAYGLRIINVARPEDLSDATNKEYVDEEIKKVSDAALSAISLNGLDFTFDKVNHKASLNIDIINCGTTTEVV